MQEMYQNYVEGEQWDLPQVGHMYLHVPSHDNHMTLYVFFISVRMQKEDPFWEPTDVDVQIGSVHVYLQSLTYMVMILTIYFYNN